MGRERLHIGITAYLGNHNQPEDTRDARAWNGLHRLITAAVAHPSFADIDAEIVEGDQVDETDRYLRDDDVPLHPPTPPALVDAAELDELRAVKARAIEMRDAGRPDLDDRNEWARQDAAREILGETS